MLIVDTPVKFMVKLIDRHHLRLHHIVNDYIFVMYWEDFDTHTCRV